MSDETLCSKSDRLVCDHCGSEDVVQRFHGLYPANHLTADPHELRRRIVWEDRYYCERCENYVSTSYMDPDWKD